MSILLIVLVIILAAAAAAVWFLLRPKPYPSVPERRRADSDMEEECVPLELDGLYCCITEDENGLVRNDVFRFYDNAGKDDNGSVLTVVISQRKPEDGYFPKEKWFCWKNLENVEGGRWKRDGNNIRITIELPKGKIIYRGTIQEHALVLDSRSEITGHRAEGRIYALYPFEKVPGWWD